MKLITKISALFLICLFSIQADTVTSDRTKQNNKPNSEESTEDTSMPPVVMGFSGNDFFKCTTSKPKKKEKNEKILTHGTTSNRMILSLLRKGYTCTSIKNKKKTIINDWFFSK